MKKECEITQSNSSNNLLLLKTFLEHKFQYFGSKAFWKSIVGIAKIYSTWLKLIDKIHGHSQMSKAAFQLLKRQWLILLVELVWQKKILSPFNFIRKSMPFWCGACARVVGSSRLHLEAVYSWSSRKIVLFIRLPSLALCWRSTLWWSFQGICPE